MSTGHFDGVQEKIFRAVKMNRPRSINSSLKKAPRARATTTTAPES